MLTGPRYRAFGSFRFLLALTVVVSHSAWMLSGTGLGQALSGARLGSSAVLGFFVLSGFVMSEASSFYAGRPSAFMRNRGLKFFPLSARRSCSPCSCIGSCSAPVCSWMA